MQAAAATRAATAAAATAEQPGHTQRDTQTAKVGKIPFPSISFHHSGQIQTAVIYQYESGREQKQNECNLTLGHLVLQREAIDCSGSALTVAVCSWLLNQLHRHIFFKPCFFFCSSRWFRLLSFNPNNSYLVCVWVLSSFFFIEMPLFVVRVLRKSFWRPPTQRAAISHSK